MKLTLMVNSGNVYWLKAETREEMIELDIFRRNAMASINVSRSIYLSRIIEGAETGEDGRLLPIKLELTIHKGNI